MNILSSRIREEREYGQLLENLSVQMKIENRAPIMARGRETLSSPLWFAKK